MSASKELMIFKQEVACSRTSFLPQGVRFRSRIHTHLDSGYNFLEIVDTVCDDFLKQSCLAERKKRGQFFTSKEVASFMAGLFEIDEKKKSFRLLDAGAGMGMLSAAFCNRAAGLNHSVSLHVDAYENDHKALTYLRKTLEACKKLLEERGHTMTFEIVEKDFVVQNPNFLKSRTLFGGNEEGALYDFAIANPPYYKLNKDSVEASVMKEFVCGQPNIYAFFMALSLEMLTPDGQMVFITPRSFCSGLYFQRFRKWLLRTGALQNIHVFESRKEVFSKMAVLQENVIIRVSPRAKNEGEVSEKVIVSTSTDSNFKDLKEFVVDYEDVLHRKNGDVFIKIPSCGLDVGVQRVMNGWRQTLKDIGLKASTGPVVSFRAKNHLTHSRNGANRTVPLLWMHNLKGFDVVWPLQKKDKEDSIRVSEETNPLLLPAKNYVLVKRFSSKEQKRRLYAAVLQKAGFDFEKVGIENHLNYIYRVNGMLSLDEAFGVAAILNTSLADKFFRMMNGNTQVNVVDIENLPLPSLDVLREIGQVVRERRLEVGAELDAAVMNLLGVDKKIIKQLTAGEEC